MRKKAGSTAERRVQQRGPTPSPASKQTASADLVCKGQPVRTPRSDARIPFRRRGRPEFLCDRLSCDHEGPTPSLRTNQNIQQQWERKKEQNGLRSPPRCGWPYGSQGRSPASSVRALGHQACCSPASYVSWCSLRACILTKSPERRDSHGIQGAEAGEEW